MGMGELLGALIGVGFGGRRQARAWRWAGEAPESTEPRFDWPPPTRIEPDRVDADCHGGTGRMRLLLDLVKCLLTLPVSSGFPASSRARPIVGLRDPYLHNRPSNPKSNPRPTAGSRGLPEVHAFRWRVRSVRTLPASQAG